MFGAEGVQTEMCSSGSDALGLVQGRIDESKPLFRLIVLDDNMHDTDGSQTALQIRYMYEISGLPVPFICCATA